MVLQQRPPVRRRTSRGRCPSAGPPGASVPAGATGFRAPRSCGPRGAFGALRALLALVLIGAAALGAAVSAPGTARAADPAAVDGERPAFGAYLDYGPRGVARMAELSQWLGGAELRVGHTYLPGDSWAGIAGDVEFLADWAGWKHSGPDRLFVLNVPMSARNEQRLSDFQVRSDLWRGAIGWNDLHFRLLAQRLVDLGLRDAVLVLGWEMNGTTYGHRCGPDPVLWKRYWKRIVTTMRSVPGQEFRFDFAPSRGKDAIGWTACYPGDDVVDIIGMDSYDQPSGITFDEQVTEPYGLQHHVEFARAHGKPISYPEWGLFRNGDNAEYMRRMLQWMERHRPVYHTITDYCPHGVWQCATNPRAAAVYRELMSQALPQPPEPVPAPPVVEPPAPEPPAPPAEPPAEPRPAEPPAQPEPTCTEVDLGPWLGQWMEEPMCVPGVPDDLGGLGDVGSLGNAGDPGGVGGAGGVRDLVDPARWGLGTA
ncbi:glycosyl hydrolase [Streptomyces sp. NPDC049906]|uniref:glycoside hydrolase family 26 protein n=1 Tax=Streptomyces sp. NPDC049906 TaxID=3155656 RepID=UPI00341261B3